MLLSCHCRHHQWVNHSRSYNWCHRKGWPNSPAYCSWQGNVYYYTLPLLGRWCSVVKAAFLLRMPACHQSSPLDNTARFYYRLDLIYIFPHPCLLIGLCGSDPSTYCKRSRQKCCRWGQKYSILAIYTYYKPCFNTKTTPPCCYSQFQKGQSPLHYATRKGMYKVRII